MVSDQQRYEDLRDEAIRRIATGYGLPVELITMSDEEFHHWLHTTDEGRALLNAPDDEPTRG
jgi:hypothetical protein